MVSKQDNRFFVPLQHGKEQADSRDISAPGPEGTLAGTLLLPSIGEPPYNTVLILPGSGPIDHNGNIPGRVTAATYQLFAEGLAKYGIASVRIDKRGLGKSAAAGDANDVTLKRYAADATSWLEVIADVPELTGDVWLAGHSEGALIAIVAARDEPPAVRALVLLCAPGRSLGTVLREQLANNPANTPVLDEASAAIEKLELGERVDPDTLHPGLRALFNVPAQGYLAELLRFDPAAALNELGGNDAPLPVLIVHGGRDIQIADEDARTLANARPDAELTVIADMNHVLKRVLSDDRDANLAVYTNPHLPIVPGVVDAVAEFVIRTCQSR